MSETQTTLRETLSAELDKLEQAQTETTQQVTNEAPETAEQKAERVRDEKGRFAASSDKTDSAKSPAANKAEQQVSASGETKRLQRPSSWKKEYWEHFDKLDPKLAEYINQREQEFAKGVSTYKNEWEQAKPLIEAITPFQQKFEQAGVQGISGADIIRNLGNAHFTLAEGSPQQKLQLVARMIQDYQIPIEHLFVQGQDGKVYFNQQILQQPAQQAQPDVPKIVEELLTQREMQKELQSMQSDTENYQHFEQVRTTMAGLLQSGLADDLKSAYHKALRMHDDIWQAEQEKARQAEEAKRQEQARANVTRAKANAVSPRTSTPSSQVTTSKGNGLRAELEKNFDEITASRV